MNRREAIGALIALGLSSSAMAGNRSRIVELDSSPASEFHLDIREANAILAGSDEIMSIDDGEVLDLSAYTSASPDAVKKLANLEFGFVRLGLVEMAPDVSRELSGWAAHFLMFERLREITWESAAALGHSGNGHALVFSNPVSPDLESARHLVRATGSENILELKLANELPHLLASTLARHGHELFLNLSDRPLTAGAARELTFHKGYHLEIDVASLPAEDVMEALSSNSSKQLSVTPGKSGRQLICLSNSSAIA